MDKNVSRREFLTDVGRFGPAIWGAYALLSAPHWLQRTLEFTRDAYAAGELERLAATAPQARYWISSVKADGHCHECHPAQIATTDPGYRHDKKIVKCLLCAQYCLIDAGKRGRCHARMNVQGELRSLVYGRPISIHIDPIEKKPFYHFLPGSIAYSLATSGCPLQCQFCQNWEISQILPEDYTVEYTEPSDIVASAEKRNVPVIAFTYNEPTVFIEYMTDIARTARPHGIRSVLISCGFMNEEPLAEMCSVLDAIKIDLKGFSETFYQRVCSAELTPVLRSIKQAVGCGVHVEIVNLVVPTLNDSDAMLRELCRWIMNEIGPDVPIHFTRFHPNYKLTNLPPTPIAILERARDMAFDSGLNYPYVGNVPDHAGNHTYCPQCRKVIIRRTGFFIAEIHIKDGTCEYCGAIIPGVWT